MCGIAGVVYNDRARPVDSALVEKMCEMIHHRGPDEWGAWCNGNVGIGMKRLRIIDLAGGSQPIHNSDKSVWIVFNGEIYNYQELRRDLEELGYSFYTTSDTETILHLYEEYGERCVTFLRGMFAFAIWDAKEKRLMLGRDRFGKKPLHYLHDGSKILFGSEIKSILQHPEVRSAVHLPAVVNYLAYGNSIDPETLFNGIAKLPPAHTLVWHDGEVTVQQYWDISFQPDFSLTEEECLERTEELLAEAVRIRLMSEVPLGAFLSGGIDSSLVVAFMARQMGAKVKTFSIGFDDPRYNELPFARQVARHFNTDHHEEIVRPDAEEVIPTLIELFDEPFADSSAIPTYYVSRLARRHVTVALSGDGGDEVFAGYDRYFEGRVPYVDKIPLTLRRIFFGGLPKILPERFPGINYLRFLAAGEDLRYILQLSKGMSALHGEVFSEDFVAAAASTDPSPALLSHLAKVQLCDPLTRKQYLDIKTYLPCDILTKVDRASMLVSLEARSPFLDHKLVEFAATIPPHIKVKNNEGKYLLKQIARKLLPQGAVQRPKMGFALPVAQWINNEWREMSRELVLGKSLANRGIFRPSFLGRLMDEHGRGRRDHSYLIWTLMVLEMWYRRFIDQQSQGL